MGYRGKVREKEEARRLRARGWRLADIAAGLDVRKGSVSLWVRDVAFEPNTRSPPQQRQPNVLERRKQTEIDEVKAAGVARIGRLSDQEFLVAGAALYAGEGAKTGNGAKFANNDPRMVAFFCAGLRHFFEVDERRLRLRLYPPGGWIWERHCNFRRR